MHLVYLAPDVHVHVLQMPKIIIPQNSFTHFGSERVKDVCVNILSCKNCQDVKIIYCNLVDGRIEFRKLIKVMLHVNIVPKVKNSNELAINFKSKDYIKF